MSPLAKLTAREKEIMELMKQGLTKKEIGHVLCIKYSTVDSHCKNIYKKLKVNSNVQAIVKLSGFK